MYSYYSFGYYKILFKLPINTNTKPKIDDIIES